MKILNKIIMGITLIVPTIAYLFIIAVYGNVEYDYIVENRKNTYEIVEVNSRLFLYDLNGDTTFLKGKVEYSTHREAYGVYLELDDIIKLNKMLHVVEKDTSGMLVINEIKYNEINKRESYKFSTAFIVSIIGIGIVALIISGKMQWQKKYPIIATFVALLTGTMILGLINTIVGSLFNVFLIFTISFGIFGIEYYLYNNKNKNVKEKELVDKKQKELENMLEVLKGAINEK